MLCDRLSDSLRAGDFLLTGSANLLLMGRVADTLAGRAIYLELPPFCPAEWHQRKNALSPLDRLFAPDFDFREWPLETGDWPTCLLRGEKNPRLVRGVVLHAGQARPLDTGILALPWGWMVAQ